MIELIYDLIATASAAVFFGAVFMYFIVLLDLVDNEKEKKKSKIIGIDFDGVFCQERYPEIGKQKWIHKLILWWIKRKQEQGNTIILVTCREGETLITAEKWLYTKGFTPNWSNENAPWLIEQYSDCRKISCDLYIDDKNIGLFGWLLRRMK